MLTPTHSQCGVALRGLLLAIAACAPAAPPESARVLLTQPSPALDGAHVEVTLVEVTYGPGGRSAPHRHSCPVVGYVLDGTYRSQVRGGAVSVYHQGESFFEAASGVHEISANASDRAPVRFLAYFLCDHGGARTIPEPVAPGGGLP